MPQLAYGDLSGESIMEKQKTKTSIYQVITIIGCVLVLLPVLAPIIFAILAYASRGRFLFDYLMPAELFLLVLAGMILLVIASLKTKRRLKLIIGSCILMIVLLFGGQALAVATGLASGEAEPAGWEWALVLGAIIGYDLLVVVLGIGGILLVKDLKHTGDGQDS